ncbi:DUF4193 family protein [Nonomuraea thailandensis]|uniref:DUF4193 family protein n=1 Tax=Nonomuraea thailandensis TaxID=1188745 RepID=UPI00355655A3
MGIRDTFSTPPKSDLATVSPAVRQARREGRQIGESRCFLVHHRSQRAPGRDDQHLCLECAA